ncbi:MAG TPA: hypothetical protein VLY87_02600 [Flavobacterium sp.]|nr:hypothetical protein [Flavobacterium sp.]
MIKKINWFDVFLALVIALMFSLMVFASNRNATRQIEQIEVKLLSSNNHFITQEMIEKIIVKSFPKEGQITNSELDIENIENQLNQNEMIAHSEVFVDINGKLHAEVTQKTAIARVINGSENYYIDTEGNKMPLSTHFSAHVPIVFGHIKSGNKEHFANLLNKIFNDTFLKTTITGIQIKPDQSLLFTVRDHDYLVEFGHLKEIDRKLDNYKAFIHYSKNDTLIGYYKNVNLRFTEQVVCTK